MTPAGEVKEALSVVKTADGYALTAKLVGVPEGTPTAGPGTEIVLDGDRFSYKRIFATPDVARTQTAGRVLLFFAERRHWIDA